MLLRVGVPLALIAAAVGYATFATAAAMPTYHVSPFNVTNGTVVEYNDPWLVTNYSKFRVYVRKYDKYFDRYYRTPCRVVSVSGDSLYFELKRPKRSGYHDLVLHPRGTEPFIRKNALYVEPPQFGWTSPSSAPPGDWVWVYGYYFGDKIPKVALYHSEYDRARGYRCPTAPKDLYFENSGYGYFPVQIPKRAHPGWYDLRIDTRLGRTWGWVEVD
jgi:hypothetical protein